MNTSARTRTRTHHRAWYRKVSRDRLFLGFLILLVSVIGLFAWQAVRASSSLRLAASQAELLQSQVVAGNDVGAKQTLRDLQVSAGRASSVTDGILWDAGAKVPFLGKNVSAVQKVSRVVDQVATNALPPVVDLSAKINLNTYSPRNGRVDLAAIAEITPSVVTAERSLAQAKATVATIDPGSLLVPLRGPVTSLQLKIDGAASAASNAKLASELLPSMLGQRGERQYLLLVQNNAEVRSTGGIPGSFAILRARNGKLSMGFQGSYSDLSQVAKPPLPLTKDESRLFPPTMGTNILDTTVTPDFPRTGQLARAILKDRRGTKVDGVISVDPVAMSYILAGTGPVQTDRKGVVLDQNNAVPLLLNTTYLSLGIKEQDDAFKIAARSIFDTITEGRIDPRLVIGGLVEGVSENRIMVWSAKREEQKLLQPSALSGALSGDAGAVPHVGMYLGDAASGKMEYYLDYNTAVTATRCLPGDVQELRSSTQLSSLAPPNAAKLSPSIVGLGLYTPKGTMKLIVRLYSPYAGGFTDVRLDGKPQTVYADADKGRNVTKVILTIKPGATHTITTTMISGRGQDRDGVFSTTPGVQKMRNDQPISSACG